MRMERSGLAISVSLLMLIAVLSGVSQPRTSAGSKLAASPVTEEAALYPQVWVNGRFEPLPDNCSPYDVLEVVEGFIEAMNTNDYEALTRIFRPDLVDADSNPATFNPGKGWFAMTTGPGMTTIRDTDELVAWVEERSAYGEQWELQKLVMAGFWWSGGVDIGFNITRQANDYQKQVVGGKGAIACVPGTVLVWTIGGLPAVSDTVFTPVANGTPTFVGTVIAVPTPNSE